MKIDLQELARLTPEARTDYAKRLREMAESEESDAEQKQSEMEILKTKLDQLKKEYDSAVDRAYNLRNFAKIVQDFDGNRPPNP